jgi:hypothetical protein
MRECLSSTEALLRNLGNATWHLLTRSLKVSKLLIISTRTVRSFIFDRAVALAVRSATSGAPPRRGRPRAKQLIQRRGVSFRQSWDFRRKMPQATRKDDTEVS